MNDIVSNKKMILSVTELNHRARILLENEMPFLCVEGEISNMARPYSGHIYFTLKDTNAQVKCVFFKQNHNDKTALLVNGQKTLVYGALSLYEPRGDYQLIATRVEPSGLGQLYIQFEALKQKLSLEGLFLSERKKPLPRYPMTIGIITSPVGAALKDILNTLSSRYPLAEPIIYPSEVQGANASQQLIHCINKANIEQRCDVIILSRGGGSIEDLWPFNDEALARTISNSVIPIISGVGHESDFTIADFVADLRAATPTQAAVLATPHFDQIRLFLKGTAHRLHHLIERDISLQKQRVTRCVHALKHVQISLWQQRQRIDLLIQSMMSCLTQCLHYYEKHRLTLEHRLLQAHPKQKILAAKQKTDQLSASLINIMNHKHTSISQSLYFLTQQLDTLSPLKTLSRGYAIALSNDKVITNAASCVPHDKVSVKLFKGTLDCEIIKIHQEDEISHD